MRPIRPSAPLAAGVATARLVIAGALAAGVLLSDPSVARAAVAAGDPPAAAEAVAARPSAPRRTPKLVVILVVDQMRADYVEKYGEHWTAGLRRLMAEGAWFRQAAYPHMTTVTCVGHSNVVTGALPARHGIVANSWWDRASGRMQGCVADAEASQVSYGAPGAGGTSTRNLAVPALPDELRLQMPVAPRIVTFSLKDYTATTLAGRKADAVTWFNGTTHAWATSSVYSSAPVPFVAEFIKANPIEKTMGEVWRKVLPEDAYLHEDAGVGERGAPQWTASFPHPLKGSGEKAEADFYEAWQSSPFSDTYLGKMAEASVDALKLGQGAGTDYLAVSFSALDLVGHDFGPRSHEVQDVLAQLDRTVGSLLEHLDRRVGRDRYVLALTADHGVAPIPEQVRAFGLSGGRLPAAEMSAQVDRALAPMLGPGKHVARISYGDMYFAPGVWDKLVANPDAMRAAVEALRATPGVARVLRGDQLEQLGQATDPLERAAAVNYFPGRSGDLFVIPRQHYFFGSGSTGTTHGSGYGYDQKVPLFLIGQGIRAGQYLDAAAPIDVAPTLAWLCGVTLSAAQGRVLNEALLPLPAPGAEGK